MQIRKQFAVVAAGAIATVALAAGPAAAATGNSVPGKGVIAQQCFGAPYGQTGIQYGQLKQNPPHPLAGGYGVPQVLAAHGPDGAIPVC